MYVCVCEQVLVCVFLVRHLYALLRVLDGRGKHTRTHTHIMEEEEEAEEH